MNSPLVKLMKYGAKPVNRLAGDTVGFQTPKKNKKNKKAKSVKAIRQPVRCPQCFALVGRLQKHINKTHVPKATSYGSPLKKGIAGAEKRVQPEKQKRLTLANEALARQLSEKQKHDTKNQQRSSRYERAKILANKLEESRLKDAKHRRFTALLVAFTSGKSDESEVKELWGFSMELKGHPLVRTALYTRLTKVADSPSVVSNSPLVQERRKNEICPGCGGDGGAAGACYKCDGTGWI